MADKLISKIPDGPLAEKWTKRKSEIHLVSPNNKRKLEIIVVGTGLGGASAAASLGELGYNVKVFAGENANSAVLVGFEEQVTKCQNSLTSRNL